MAERWYYLGPWVWEIEADLSYWRAPVGCKGCIDFRSTPQMAASGGPASGLGIFALDHQLADSDYGLIARNIDDPIGPARRSQISSRLGKQVTQNRLDRMIYELLTLRADPTGDDFARPLIPTLRRQLDINLEGRIFRKRWRHDLTEMPAMMHQIREQYRIDRQLVLDGVLPPNHHRRVLDYKRKKYRIDWRLLKPDDLPDEEPLDHTTIITESFNTADSDTLGPDLTWTELAGDMDVVSNQMRSISASNNTPRADHDLSGDDHYTQIDITASSDNSADPGVNSRFDAAGAETYYHGRQELDTGNHQLYRRVTGTFTLIDGPNADAAPSLTITVKVESDGSTQTFYVDDVQQAQATDTNITGNLRTGVRTNKGGIDHDNFEAADLAAAAGNPWYQYQQQQAGAA